MGYEVHVLHSGYSGSTDKGMVANCSCTLVRGRNNIIVDTMTPWDKDKIVSALALHKLTPDDIQFVVCTHGHSDHVGNNNLFLYAKHIVGFSVSFKDQYSLHPFEDGQPFVIDDDVKVIPTPGHTNTDVSVIVRTKSMGTVAIVESPVHWTRTGLYQLLFSSGDLFEKEEDLKDSSIWRTLGGSENPRSQERYRNAVLLMANYIVPGHGPMFPVTLAARDEANKKSTQSTGQVNYLPPSFIKCGFAPPSIFESVSGSRWLDDSSNLRKRSPLGASPPRYWEDRLSERDGRSATLNPVSLEYPCRQDLCLGSRESDTKSFYESGSRSLDTHVNFEDVFENRKARGGQDLNTWELNTREKKRYTSDNPLYGEDCKSSFKQNSNVDMLCGMQENSQGKQTSCFKLGLGDECTSTSKKAQEISKLSRQLNWQDLEHKSGEDRTSWRVNESKLSHSYRLDVGKETGVVSDKIKDQKLKLFSSDETDLKEKFSLDDKLDKNVSFNRGFYSKSGRSDNLCQDDSLDLFKKLDRKVYSYDKTEDWWKNEKRAKDSNFPTSDGKGSYDKSREFKSEDPLKLTLSDSESGNILDSHSSKNVTVLMNVTSRREDRFNRVIT